MTSWYNMDATRPFGILLLLINIYTSVNGNLTEERLKLLTDYNKNEPPSSGRIHVEFGASHPKVRSLDATSQVLSSTLILEMSWQDERFSIDSQPTREIPFTVDEVWMPKTRTVNSVHVDKHIQPSGMVTLRNGTLHISWLENIESSCKVDLTKYPFDEHECEIVFAPFKFSNIVFGVAPTDNVKSHHTQLLPSQEWNIVEARSENTEVENGSGKPETRFAFKLTVKRSSSQYRFSVIIPLAVIGMVVVPLAFCLPVESPVKLQLPIVMLVVVAAMLLEVGFRVPPLGNAVPNLLQFTAFVMLMAVAVLVLEVLVVCLTVPKPCSDRVPPWLWKITAKMGKCCCTNTNIDSRQSGQIAMLQTQEIGDPAEKKQGSAGTAVHAWQLVGIVLDRLFFISYIVIFIVFAGLIHA